MKKDAIEARKEKDEKPKNLYTINCNIWNDNKYSGKFWENGVKFGREKNKMAYVSGSEFIASMRAIIPSAVPKLEALIMRIDSDAGDEQDSDPKDNEIIAKITINVYSNSFIEVDGGAIMKFSGPGRPKLFRMGLKDLMEHIHIGTSNEEPIRVLNETCSNSQGFINTTGKTIKE